MNEPETKVDKFSSRIKNNPVLAALIILGMIIIALSTFSDAAKNLIDLVIHESRPDINGVWTVGVSYPSIRDMYTETFSFSGHDNEVNGEASYLEKKQVILDGKTLKDQIEFKTKTTEYSPDWGNDATKLATHHYRGRILGSEIEFVMETYGGFSSNPPIKFTARRAPESSN